MNTVTSNKKSPLKFFLLVFVLFIPFLVLGAMTRLMLLPGLPIAALGFICPVIAAIILEYRENKGAGVRALLKRSFDFRRIKVKTWYIPLLLLYPIALVLSFFVIRLSGTHLPAPFITLQSTLILFVVFFIAALGEELGWSGYTIDPMQERWGALKASILLGLVWAAWHYVPLVQANRSVMWITWWTLYTVASRVIMVWLFNNMGKSVFAMVVFHMILNVGWQLFPVNGSFFDPRITGLILAVVVIVIVVVWEPRTLVKYRNRRRFQLR